MLWLVVALAPAARGQISAPGSETDLLDSVLARVVTDDGRVRYDVAASSQDLKMAVARMAHFDASRLTTDAERLAFWINAYNANMLLRVAAQPDREQVLGDDNGAFFFQEPIRVARRLVTLDEIERGILRRGSSDPDLHTLAPSKEEPRIHVALNCAAASCPRPWPEAYRAERLEDQLNQAMREFVNDPRHISVADDTLRLSSLLDWFGSDFDATGVPAGDYLLQFMRPDRPDYIALKRLLKGRDAAALKEAGARYRYDWAVNRAPR